MNRCILSFLLILFSCSKKNTKPKIDKISIKDSLATFNLTYDITKSQYGNDFYEISKIEFDYNGKTQSIKYNMIINDSLELKDPKIYFKDFNFDGFEDLMIYKLESGIRNWYFDKFIFDQRIQEFIYDSTLSKLTNCEVDTINKILISTVFKGKGEISSVSKYKWKENSLVLIK